LHPLESAAFSRRTQIAVIDQRVHRTGQVDPERTFLFGLRYGRNA
jgi:hypothetical protein